MPDVYRAAIEKAGWAHRLGECLKGHRNARDKIDADTDTDPDPDNEGEAILKISFTQSALLKASCLGD